MLSTLTEMIKLGKVAYNETLQRHTSRMGL